MTSKKRIVYGVVVFIVLFIFFAYEYLQTQQTNDLIELTKSELQQQITSLEEKNTKLNQDLQSTQVEVNKLMSDLEEKDTEIAGLSGELDQLKIESQQQLGVLEDQITNLKIQNEDFSEVIEMTIPAVVSIRTNAGSGSGFFVRNSGYLVTNYHVIDGVRAASVVTSDGDSHGVTLIGSNPTADIAVLKVDGNFQKLSFGNSNSINVGEKVIAVGNPGGLDFTVTQGIVSAVNREDAFGNNFIQIDVAINPGNSGGPLVNAAGKVIGVNTKKIASFEGVGFALESNLVREIADDFIAAHQESLVTE